MIKQWSGKEFWFYFFALFSLLIAFFKIVVHLKFILLPLLFIISGFVLYLFSSRRALYVFFFLLPLVNSTADLFFIGLPYNYFGIPLFYLSGIIVASVVKKERISSDSNWSGWYLLFLVLVWISALFVFLRWSNLTLSPLAFFKDTPVCPSGDRISFASIFPVITLFIFSVSPFVVFLIRKDNLKEVKIFKSILIGYYISVVLGIYQKFVDPDFLAQKWWLGKLGQTGAGFSDPNAFGFFSGSILLYLTITFIFYLFKKESVYPKNKSNTLFFIVSFLFCLAGIFISGSRTGFLFVVAAIIFISISKHIKFYHKIVVIVILCIIFFIAGGILRERMTDNFEKFLSALESPDMIASFDKLSNYRISMLKYSFETFRQYPVCGVGAGNFLFFLKNLKYDESFVEDLPLNQYLLIMDETGVLGLAAFIVFVICLLKSNSKKVFKWIIAVITALIFFGNFFWLPEISLFFWIFVSFLKNKEHNQKKVSRKKSIIPVLLVSIFILGNILCFMELHPVTWAADKKTDYDYGFWYPEKDGNRHFRWSTEKAGFYTSLDKEGKSKDIHLFCGAPLHKFESKEQRLNIFWRGKLYKGIIFKENKNFVFSIRDKPLKNGFVELRVYPAFNLKKMGLSEETRDLGIQVSFAL